MANTTKGPGSVIKETNAKPRSVIGSEDFIKQPSKSLQRRTLLFKPAILFATILILYTNCLKPVQSDSDLSLPNNEEDDPSKEVEKCEVCQLLVSSFEKGIDETSRGKHEGGDTSWEERNLKSYSDSEVRLVEIQEKICEDVKKGKAQCLSLAEDTESEVEDWWFKQRNKNVRLHDFLCISKLKLCCPSGKFGPTCQACPSDCNKHGVCDGTGTRRGTGKCDCDSGYTGEECESCDHDHFRIATSDHFTCRKCDPACKGCFGIGPTNCTECRSGYYQNEVAGCIDVNECDIGMDVNGNTKLCKGNTYCVNTDGSYRCEACHVTCSGCVGYGPKMCISCARGYQMDDDYSCRSREELEELEKLEREQTMRHGKGTAARYFFYIGVLAVSVMMFRSNLYVMYTFTLSLIVLLILSEFNLLDELEQDNIKTSSQ